MNQRMEELSRHAGSSSRSTSFGESLTHGHTGDLALRICKAQLRSSGIEQVRTPFLRGAVPSSFQPALHGKFTRETSRQHSQTSGPQVLKSPRAPTPLLQLEHRVGPNRKDMAKPTPRVRC